MSGPGALILSIGVIAAFLLGAGGVTMIVRGGERRKGALMLVAALVLLGNVAIWAVPA